MRVGIHESSRSVEEITTHCLDTDVNEIFLRANSLPGVDQLGHLTPENFKPFEDMLQKRDVRVYGMIVPVPSKEAVLGQHEAELDSLCQTLRDIGQSGIDTVLFYPLDRLIYFHEYHRGRSLMVIPCEEGWSAIIEFFRRAVSVVDEVNLKLANHL